MRKKSSAINGAYAVIKLLSIIDKGTPKSIKKMLKESATYSDFLKAGAFVEDKDDLLEIHRAIDEEAANPTPVQGGGTRRRSRATTRSRRRR